MPQRQNSRSLLLLWIFVVATTITIAGLTDRTHADLFIRDDISDTGIEPNPSTNPMWLSRDIWVRNDPLPGWNPRPYPIANPPSWVDATHFNPDYRSPLSGSPNYVYVRVRNKGTASTGTERLLFYWSSASTGLSWDPAKVGGSFIDNVQGGVLFGAEITKVRKNAASASQTERDAYIAAILKINDIADPAMSFPNGGDTYWHTQQEIHRFGPTYRHGVNVPPTTFVPSVAFLPWHREYINRYEGLLQEADPKVKLLYWNWNENPGTGPFNFYSNTFMGTSGFGLAAGVSIGPPLSPRTNPLYVNPFSSATTVVRRLENFTPTEPDTTVVGRVDYDSATLASNFSGALERRSHNNSHGFIGGDWRPPQSSNGALLGDLSILPLAARDPFFFLLHGKVDELWARWQRKSLNNLDPATTYGSAAGHVTITGTMGPWDGTAVPDTLPNNLSAPEIDPWTMAGGQIYAKPANDRSVTSPPFYDTAPLTIPVLQPGEEVILEIPWYPPNPASFGSVADPQHVCLIARIETSAITPFGMTVAETSDINFNTQQNNDIAWRNVSVVDSFPGAFRSVKFLMRNHSPEPVTAGLLLGAKLNEFGGAFFKLGNVRVDLGRELFGRWKESGAKGRGIEPLPDGQLKVFHEGAVLEEIKLKSDEVFPVRLIFELNRDYRPTKKGEQIVYDIVQTGVPGDPRAIVGGQRYEIAVEKLTLVQQGRTWRLLLGSKRLSEKWSGIDFDDSGWYERRLDLGLVGVSSAKGGPVTTYFRYAFDVEDPEFVRNLLMRIKRSDGAIAYLNDKEVYRANMPDGVVSIRTPARTAIAGIERNTYFPVKLDPSLLLKGRNVLAVEIHRAENNRGDQTFDLELNANWESPHLVPGIQFANISEGALFPIKRMAAIEVDALDTDGSVRSVTLMVDGKAVETLEKAPFKFKWRVRPGPHRLTAVVTDSDGQHAQAHSTITGVRNVPPTVELIQPAPHTEIAVGDAIVAVARAKDPDGKIAKVDFFVHDSFVIGAPGRFIGSSRTEPYTVTLRKLKKTHAMVTAVAFDDGGARTASIPIMVIVGPHGKPNR